MQTLHQPPRHNRPFRNLPAGLTQYVFNNSTTKSPPFTSPQTTSPCPSSVWRSTRSLATGSVRGRGGATAVLYETHWKGLLRPSWEREADLLHARQHILEYWAGAPLQPGQANRVCRRMRVGAVLRELARAKGDRFYLPNIATSITKRGPADSVAPSCLSVPTSGTRVKIIFGRSAKFEHTLQLLDST